MKRGHCITTVYSAPPTKPVLCAGRPNNRGMIHLANIHGSPVCHTTDIQCLRGYWLNRLTRRPTCIYRLVCFRIPQNFIFSYTHPWCRGILIWPSLEAWWMKTWEIWEIVLELLMSFIQRNTNVISCKNDKIRHKKSHNRIKKKTVFGCGLIWVCLTCD